MNVQKFIDEWKIGMKLGRWTSEKLDYSVYKNEEMFIINVELKINLDPNIPIIISKNRFFQTSYNTLSKEHQLNPNFDENMLVNILEDLENQLNEETNHLGL